MTIAVDIRTGKVLGQVPDAMTAPMGTVILITKDGYGIVPAASVRLEDVA